MLDFNTNSVLPHLFVLAKTGVFTGLCTHRGWPFLRVQHPLNASTTDTFYSAPPICPIMKVTMLRQKWGLSPHIKGRVSSPRLIKRKVGSKGSDKWWQANQGNLNGIVGELSDTRSSHANWVLLSNSIFRSNKLNFFPFKGPMIIAYELGFER